MNIAEMTIKEIEKIFLQGEVTEAFLAECQNDGRKAAQQLVKRYQREQKERQRVAAMYSYEDEARAQGAEYIAGVDEAGRGPLAGPVVVGAVILPPDLYLPKINDSKKLSAKVREELYAEIKAKALAVQTAVISEKVIDRINIYQATINGMYDAIFALQPEPQHVLIDAVKLEQLPMSSQSIIKGDAKSASIAAASIIAKVERDHLMEEYAKQYPEYGFDSHKGYGTADHIAAIRKYGPCPIHRMSFAPLSTMF